MKQSLMFIKLQLSNNKSTIKNGFTLIELFVVISIVAILALIALPSQFSRMNQQKVAETIALVTGYKSNIAIFYSFNEKFPVNNAEADMPEPEKIIGHYLKSLQVENGVMHLTFGNKLKSQEDEVLSIFPVYVEGSPFSPISWVCGYDSIPDGMTPAGQNKTSIEKTYLPVSCR